MKFLSGSLSRDMSRGEAKGVQFPRVLGGGGAVSRFPELVRLEDR